MNKKMRVLLMVCLWSLLGFGRLSAQDKSPAQNATAGTQARSHVDLGDEYFRNGQYEEAAREYRVAISVHEDFSRAISGMQRVQEKESNSLPVVFGHLLSGTATETDRVQVTVIGICIMVVIALFCLFIYMKRKKQLPPSNQPKNLTSALRVVAAIYIVHIPFKLLLMWGMGTWSSVTWWNWWWK